MHRCVGSYDAAEQQRPAPGAVHHGHREEGRGELEHPEADADLWPPRVGACVGRRVSAPEAAECFGSLLLMALILVDSSSCASGVVPCR